MSDQGPDPSGRPEPPPLRSDGLPTLPTGEPVLYRWFVIALLLLIPIAVAVSIWAFLSVDREELTAAERRPPGGPEITIARGQAVLAETQEAEPGPGCAQAVRLVGDVGSRTTAELALEVVCELIESGDYPEARDGLVELIAGDGRVRVGTFQLAGVESSTRLEDGQLVVELNAKFQFEDHTRAAPALIHQLVLIAAPDWPGETISVERELLAARIQARACEDLQLDPREVRGCLDVQELLDAEDPAELLAEAGFRRDGAP